MCQMKFFHTSGYGSFSDRLSIAIETQRRNGEWLSQALFVVACKHNIQIGPLLF